MGFAAPFQLSSALLSKELVRVLWAAGQMLVASPLI